MAMTSKDVSLIDVATGAAAAASTSKPDPSPLPAPFGWRVLLRPLDYIEKVGSIYIAPTAVDKQKHLTTVARVLAIGPAAFTKEGMGEPWYKVGDHVMIGKHTGWKFQYDGVDLIYINDDEALGIAADPTKVKRDI